MARRRRRRSDAAAHAADATAAERGFLDERRRELVTLAVTESEWSHLSAAQSRLANAADLIAAANEGVAALSDADDALAVRLSQLTQRLRSVAGHDPALAEVVALLEPAAIQLDEAARALRDYQRRLDLDPDELKRVEERLSAIHDVARKHRVRPEALPALLAETEARLAALAESANAEALAARAAEAEKQYRVAAGQLSKKRNFAANEFAHRVTDAMQALAMAGGRLDVALEPVAAPASYGLEQVELRVASHPKQPLGPLARVASGGELSRIALAIQVVASEVGQVPTLVFDEVDSGIGGAVAATVGGLLQTLGARQAGVVRDASAAGGGVRGHALSRDQDRQRRQRDQRPRAAFRRRSRRGTGAHAGRRAGHRQDARARDRNCWRLAPGVRSQLADDSHVSVFGRRIERRCATAGLAPRRLDAVGELRLPRPSRA